MSAPFTALDIIFFVVVLLSGILAMLRGFTREVLSILSWVAAAAAAFFIYPSMRGRVREMVEPDWLADIVLVAGTFVVVLIVVSFITVRITDLILQSRVGAIDRTLGFVFGVARGLVLVVVAYLFVNWLLPAEQQPEWVRGAQTRPFMEDAGDVILSFLPEDPSDLIDQLPGDLGNIGRGGDASPPDAEPPADDGIGDGTDDGSTDPSSLPAPGGNSGGRDFDLEDARLIAVGLSRA